MLTYILLCSTLFTLITASIQIYSDYRQDVSSVDERMAFIETSYMKSLTRSLWSLDQKLLKVQLQGILALPDIIGLKLKIYPDKEIIMGNIDKDTSLKTHSFPLIHKSDETYTLGELTIIASMDDIYKKLEEKIVVILTTQAFKTFFISILILWIFQFLVTRHLSKMAYYASNIRLDSLDTPLTLERRIDANNQYDELSQVADALNIMRKTLNDDLKNQKISQDEIRKLSLAIDQSPSSVLICNNHWKIEYSNDKFTRLTGFDKSELLGLEPDEITTQTDPDLQRLWNNIQSQVKQVGEWQGELHSARKNGERFWQQLTVTPMKNGEEDTTHYLILGEDISIRKRYEQQLLRQANYDILTGLPNRMLALDRLKLATAQAKRDDGLVGLMFLDLDNFKHINDTMGHDVGDTLLIEASRRISSCLRGSSTVARLGGDEFLVILPGLEHTEDAEQVAERILKTFETSYQLDKQDVFISTSIGIAFYPLDAEDHSILMQNADTAMYRAKSMGKSAYQRFLPEMKHHSQERLKIEGRLRRALELDEFFLHYQPIIDLTTGKLIGAEALIRWQTPSLGMVMPDKFIPLAEENGLIIPIGEWVLRTACNDIKRWIDELEMKFTVAVNLSPRQFKDVNFINMLDDIIESNQIPYSAIELEITERLILDNTIETSDILGSLDRKGIRLSVDDFGTGYSALGYLKSYPFDTLKIDKSFVQDVNVEAEDAALVKAIITMAHSLGLQVIAEGVEEYDQLDFLKENGCDFAQGYLYSRPVPAEEFQEWILQNAK
jgi:diguanylate cyclase (GGDEF)-like protein/PAS domain S-box-containing protein